MDSINYPKVYNIPAHQPFLVSFAKGVLERAGRTPENLSSIKILLPTRRACNSLREIFLNISETSSTLLPHMSPLGDIESVDFSFNSEINSLEEFDLDFNLSISPAISNIKRQLLLARLVMARGNIEADQAIQLAKELAYLLDQIHNERLSLTDLENLAPSEYTVHWQEVLYFLKVVINEWPAILETEGMLDPTQRRNKILEAQAKAWEQNPPKSVIYAAGSTGSIPATADLLSVISRLPQGAVILPGVDLRCDKKLWDKLEPHHPQYGLALLLSRVGVERKNILTWIAEKNVSFHFVREDLVNLAFNSQLNSQVYDLDLKQKHEALLKFQRIDCSAPRMEAGVIALAIRHALETPNKTVALVTPDRALARRVVCELERWLIKVDDSAGKLILVTMEGSFLRLVSKMICENFSPVATLAALKHPLSCGGLSKNKFSYLVRELERLIFRGPRPKGGILGIRTLIEIEPQKKAVLEPLILNLENIFSKFIKEFSKPTVTFSTILEMHLDAAEKLAETDLLSGSERLWSKGVGSELATFFRVLSKESIIIDSFDPNFYPIILDALMMGNVVREHFGMHPRVSIWGLMEARLHRADMMILAGLNEDTWPPEVKSSPWMSRPMMEKVGLSLPDRRVGLTAHDFFQGCTAKEVMLTRSITVKGTPTIPSRWLTRLEIFLRVLGQNINQTSQNNFIEWFQKIDTPSFVKPIKPPSPTPPIFARPRTLSVTRVETLIRDPYAIYAEKILSLKPLDLLDADPSAAERGSLIHESLELFIKELPVHKMPEEAYQMLVSIGKKVFKEAGSHPGVIAFWWPRFLRIAKWFVEFEANRRRNGARNLGIEVKGELMILSDNKPFVLTARVDRIDCLADGSLSIIDYKTGAPPSLKQVSSGLVPQLLLEAIIAKAAGVEGIEKTFVSELAYVRLSGGRVPGEFKPLILNLRENMETAYIGLCQLIAKFDLVGTPYLSRPRPQFKSRFNSYDHLARVKEWGYSSLDENH